MKDFYKYFRNKRLQEDIEIEGKLIEIEWIDACETNNISLKEIKETSVKDLCIVRKTIGYLIKEDDFGKVLIIDQDERDMCEIFAIPNEWITRTIEK